MRIHWDDQTEAALPDGVVRDHAALVNSATCSSSVQLTIWTLPWCNVRRENCCGERVESVGDRANRLRSPARVAC